MEGFENPIDCVTAATTLAGEVAASVLIEQPVVIRLKLENAAAVA
jgi:hypothetical protein